jgi:hypothetical protein
VRVPEEAGLGKAKVTYSFDAWTEGRIAPMTIEIPVLEARVEDAERKK